MKGDAFTNGIVLFDLLFFVNCALKQLSLTNFLLALHLEMKTCYYFLFQSLKIKNEKASDITNSDLSIFDKYSFVLSAMILNGL